MSEQKQSRFLKAKCKEFTTSSGRTGRNININKLDFNNFPTNDYWEVQLTMRPRKEKSEYWETHFIVENDFVKWEKKQTDNSAIPDNWVRTDSLPF